MATSIRHFIDRQLQLLLDSPYHAFLYLVVFCILPFGTWIAVAIMALLTLRKGWQEGLRACILGVGTIFFLSWLSLPWYFALFSGILTFLPCFLMAMVLRWTADWQLSSHALLGMILLGLLLIHWLAPHFILEQFKGLQRLISQLKTQTDMTKFISQANSNQQSILAYCFLGVQGLSVALFALMSLLLARFLQSKLFYPGGFRQEMLYFKTNKFIILLLLLVGIGIFQHNLLAIASFPILVLYYLAGGLSLSYYFLYQDLAKGKTAIVLLVGMLLFLFFPFVILSLYICMAVLDALFDFRRLSSSSNGKENKG